MKTTKGARFDLDRFIADCRGALAENAPQDAVRELLARAVSEPGALTRVIGEPKGAGLQAIHRSAELTILNSVWPPGMTIMPHEHRMWAVIGIYCGREDNIFWRRLDGGRVEAAGAKALGERDTAVLGADVIHSVSNPIQRCTGAIHIYGGDFFAVPRSEWDPETLLEQPFDLDKALRLFAEAGARARAS